MGRIFFSLIILFFLATVNTTVQGCPLAEPENNTSSYVPGVLPPSPQSSLAPILYGNWQTLISEAQITVVHSFTPNTNRSYKNGLHHRHLCGTSKIPQHFYNITNHCQSITTGHYANGFYLHFLKKLII